MSLHPSELRVLKDILGEQKRTNQLLEQVLIAMNKPDITVEQKSQYVGGQLYRYFGRKADTYGGTAGAPEEGSK